MGCVLSKPFLFVGHRAEVAQGRVQAGMVVSCEPRHDFVNRCAAIAEIMAMD